MICSVLRVQGKRLAKPRPAHISSSSLQSHVYSGNGYPIWSYLSASYLTVHMTWLLCGKLSSRILTIPTHGANHSNSYGHTPRQCSCMNFPPVWLLLTRRRGQTMYPFRPCQRINETCCWNDSALPWSHHFVGTFNLRDAYSTLLVPLHYKSISALPQTLAWYHQDSWHNFVHPWISNAGTSAACRWGKLASRGLRSSLNKHTSCRAV